VGKYRELATSRELAYVEENGAGCPSTEHRRNHRVISRPPVPAAPLSLTKKAS
jgi:hypothetical protein